MRTPLNVQPAPRTERSLPASAGGVPRSERSESLEQAIKDGIPLSVIEAAQQSRFIKWRWNGNWRCRCIQNIATADGLVRAASVSDSVCSRRGELGSNGILPDVESLRIPVQIWRIC